MARAVGVDDRVLAVEATAALMTFADHPAALVAGCRRVLARQPCCGALWWACARMLTAEDLWATAHETITMLEDDPTDAALSYALGEHAAEDPVGRPDVEIRRVRAMGADAAVLVEEPPGRSATSGPGNPRWLVAGVGTRLSAPMWDALLSAVAGSGRDDHPGWVVADLREFTHVVGPLGPVPVAALGEPDCPVAPELFTLQG